MSISQYSRTPVIKVVDNRGLSVCEIAYYRHPDSLDTTDERLTRHQYNVRGFLTQSADPRLYDLGLANFTWLTDLASNVLRTQSVDTGISVALNDAANRPFLAVTDIMPGGDRSQSITHTWQYEDNALPGRLLSVAELVSGKERRVIERFIWATNDQQEQDINRAGELISHYDTAGVVQTNNLSIGGVPLSVTRQLFKDADNPDITIDWQGADASAWNDQLGSETYTTLNTVDALGMVLNTTDAMGNMQRVAFNVTGLLKGSWLTLNGGTEQVIITSLTYSAAGQKLREEHGNGVITSYSYEPETQRLIGIKTERPSGHPAGAKVLQDLRYEYDPVGNVLVITNDAEETRFWRNQEVVPRNAYSYDSLYQLVSATGREMANAAQQSSDLPAFTHFDNAIYTNYTRTYSYDRADNLTKIQHSAPASGNNYTTTLTVSDQSNRAVLNTITENPAEVDALFTAGGQQRQLLPGQSLFWTPRRELQKVTPVTRTGAADDSESYLYDTNSQRILKTSTQMTDSSSRSRRTLYLPMLELRSTANGGTETENLQVITIGAAGRAQVRVLHWESGQPAELANDPIRYNYDNLTGSSSLEVDGNGETISQEEYYPYGGTAILTARSEIESDYKIIRYSGKERDATGLYYYGYRYYQPWVGRWLSADPAGTMDSLNVYQMVKNNPVSLIDPDGRVSMPAETLIVDVLNPYSKDPTNAWFEELTWNPHENRLNATPEVYTSRLKVMQGQQSQWRSFENTQTAFAVFQDESAAPRLFISTYNQHIGIKPGMGNPLYAGIMVYKKSEQGELYYQIDNNSGHYQPNSNIDAAALFSQIIPAEGMSHFRFSKTSKTAAPENTRLTHITSVEDYGQLASDFRSGGNKEQNLIKYFNEHGLWEPLKSQRSHMPWVEELMKWEKQQNAATSARPVATAAPPVNTMRSKAAPLPTQRQSSPGLWKRFTAWVARIFNKQKPSQNTATMNQAVLH